MGLAGRGVEPDRSYADYSAETLDVDVTHAFFEDYPEDTGALDAIVLHHVLEHTEAPYRTLLKARDLLRDGGFLVVGVPNAEDLRQAPYNRYHKAHLYTFNPETLEAMGRKAGFRVYKRIVGNRNGNIIMTFRRQAGSEQQITGLPGSYERIKHTLDRFHTLRYFTTITPYRTVLDKLLVSRREKATLRQCGSAKEIIDFVIQRQIRPACKAAGT
jgi:SAM-dependent methyltransferase